MVLKSPHCLSPKNYEKFKNQILEKLKKYLEIQPTNKNIQETNKEKETKQTKRTKNLNNADLCENSHRQDDHSGGGGERYS